MHKVSRAIMVLLLSALLASSALQACCDDFWSCAGAVATAGMSCAVEAALNAIKDVIAKAEGTRDSKKAELEADLAASKKETDADLETTSQRAHAAAADAAK